MKNKKYWEFKALSDTEAELYFYLEVASWGGGYSAHSAQSFKEELDDLGDINTLNIYMNSPGGDVFEGIAIYNMLKRHKAHINVYVDGLAASIASVIAMAGDNIIVQNGAMMMVHNAWAYTSGNSSELREMADMLDKVNNSIREAYMNKIGNKATDEDIKALMKNETWLTSTECLQYGLCDDIGDSIDIAAKVQDFNNLNNYKNTPKSLLSNKNNMIIENEMEEITVLNNRVEQLLRGELDNE